MSYEAAQYSLIPSTKNALAPRGGVALDGTNNARLVSTLTGQNIGTDDFSVSLMFSITAEIASSQDAIWQLGSTSSSVAPNGSIRCLVDGGALMIELVNGSGVSRLLSTANTFMTTFAGKSVNCVFTRSGATVKLYLNGVDTTITFSGAASFADSITSTYLLLGSPAPGYILQGAIQSASVYNLAISPADVLEIYQLNGAVPERYKFGSQASKNTLAFTTADGFTYATFTGASATGFTAAEAVTSYRRARTPTGMGLQIKIGQTWRTSFTSTLTSGDIPRICLFEVGISVSSNQPSITAGANVINLVATRNVTDATLLIDTNTSTSYAISGLVLKQLGAVVYLPLEDGTGLTAYDVSTNALNATLTATGVTWTKPVAPASFTAPALTSLTLSGGSSGATLVLGQGTSGVATLTSKGGTAVRLTGSDGGAGTSIAEFYNGSTVTAWVAGGGVFSTPRVSGTGTGLILASNAIGQPLQFFLASEVARFSPTNGNLLIGTTTDITGTGGLHVAGTATATAVGAGGGGAFRVGTNVNLSGNAGGASYFGGQVNIAASGANGLIVRPASGNSLAIFDASAGGADANAYISLQTSGTNRWVFGQSISTASGDFEIYSTPLGASALKLAKATGAATFAGGLLTQTGGFRSAGSLSLGATYASIGGGFQIDYTSPVTTQFFGDGTGFSMVWATRAASTTTPRMTLTDAGNLTVHGTGGIQLNSVANLTWGGAYGAGIPAIAVPSAGKLGVYPNGSTSGLIGEYSSTGLAVTGTVRATRIGVGTAGQTYRGIDVFSPLTASAGEASTFIGTNTLTTAANNDVLAVFNSASGFSNAGAFTNTTTASFYAPNKTHVGAFGYGLFIGNVTGATSNYAIRTLSGIVSIGDATPSTGVGTGALQVAGGIYAGQPSVFGSTLSVKGPEAGATTGISAIIENTTAANNRVAALRLVNLSSQWNVRAVGSGDTFSIGPGASGSETNYFTLSAAGAATFAGAVNAGGNVLVSSASSSAFPSFQSQNNNGANATLQMGTSGSARAGTYFGSAEANLSLIFANGTSSTGLGIGTFNAKPLVLGTNNTAALTINATTQAATFAGQGNFQAASPQIVIGAGATAINQIGFLYSSGGQYFGLSGNRNPNSGVFANIAGTHASIDLDTGSGGSSITFRTTATPNTLGNVMLTLASSGKAIFENAAIIQGLTVGLGGSDIFGNVAVGIEALLNNTTGSPNTAIGSLSLYNNTTGSANTAIASASLYNNTTGSSNTAIGYQALYNNTTGSVNNATGGFALYYNTTGRGNTANGEGALYAIEPTSKAISAFADYSATVADTVRATSVGHGLTGTVTREITGTVNYNGSYSVTVINADSFYFTATFVETETGWWSVYSEGNYNTALGANAGSGIVTGSGNTILGANVEGPATDLINNIILGNGTGAIKAQHDGTNWTLTGAVTSTGAVIGGESIQARRVANTGSIYLTATSGVSSGSDISSYNNSGASYAQLNSRGNSINFYTGASGNTLALSITNAQLATFAGTVNGTRIALNDTASSSSYPLTVKNAALKGSAGQYVGLMLQTADASSVDLGLLYFGATATADRSWRLGAFDNGGTGWAKGVLPGALTISEDLTVGFSGTDAHRAIDIIGAGTAKDFGLKLGGGYSVWRNTSTGNLNLGTSGVASLIINNSTGAATHISTSYTTNIGLAPAASIVGAYQVTSSVGTETPVIGVGDGTRSGAIYGMQNGANISQFRFGHQQGSVFYEAVKFLSGMTAATHVATFSGTTPSTLTTNGAVVVAGGVGIGGAVTASYLNSVGGSAFNQFGSGTRTKVTLSGASGEVAFDNNTVDSPGVHFYTGNNANYGIDATASVGLRLVKNMDEAGGTVVASFTDTAATFASAATATKFNVTDGTTFLSQYSSGILGSVADGLNVIASKGSVQIAIDIDNDQTLRNFTIVTNGASNGVGGAVSGGSSLFTMTETGNTTFFSVTPGVSTISAAVIATSLGLSENLFVGGLASANRWETVAGTLPYSATPSVNFTSSGLLTLTLTGNAAFNPSSNIAAGRGQVIRIVGDTVSRTLSFPAGWVFIGGSAPTSIAANKTGILSVTSFGTSDVGIIAAWSVQS